MHDRSLGGRADKILRTLPLDPLAGQTEPTVLLSGPPLGTVWGWVDDSHLVVVSDRWVKLLTTGGATVYEVPGGTTVLGVLPVR